jgi:hypothetical protein
LRSSISFTCRPRDHENPRVENFRNIIVPIQKIIAIKSDNI